MINAATQKELVAFFIGVQHVCRHESKFISDDKPESGTLFSSNVRSRRGSTLVLSGGREGKYFDHLSLDINSYCREGS